jgi:scyllo-inositol 2-dehydrogenase (NADP+)
MRQIGVGLIGLGNSGRNIHGIQLQKMPEQFRLIAASDPLQQRLDRAKAEWGCDTCTDYHELMRRTDLDLIVIACPSHLHVPMSAEFLEAGFNVLCEKPLASRAADVDSLIRVSRKARRVLAAFQLHRFDGDYQHMLRVVRSGILGRIVLAKFTFNRFTRRWDWQTLRKNMGGSLLNSGPHPIDKIVHFLGKPEARLEVTCVMDRTNTYGDAEDHVKLLLQGEGLPTVDLEISCCCAYKESAINIYGTRGGLIVTAKGGVEWKYYVPAEQAKRRLVEQPIANDAGIPAYCDEKLAWHEEKVEPEAAGTDPAIAFYRMLHRTLTDGAALEVTLEEVRQQIAIIEECHRQNPPSRMPLADVEA